MSRIVKELVFLVFGRGMIVGAFKNWLEVRGIDDKPS